MTTSRQTLFNTREQILSSDLTRIGALAGKAAMDVALWAEASNLVGTPRDVVLRGLDAAAGAGLSIDVEAGYLAQFDVALTGDNSQYKLGWLSAQANVAFPANASGNPRIDVVYATVGSNDTDSSVRNIIALPARTVSAVAVNKTRDPEITLTIASGIPNASPTLPAVPAGAVPLWYVFIAGGAVSLTDDELIDARVQFNPAPVTDSHARKFGLLVSTGSGGLNFVRLGSGEATVNGAQVRQDAAVEWDGTTIRPTTPGAIVTDTEYHLYLVGKGSGDLVGKTAAQNFIPVLDTIAPGADGRPSVALSYRPLRGFNDALVLTTTDALYVGTMLAQTTPNFQESSGFPLTKDGSRQNFLARGADKGLPSISGFPAIIGAKPRMVWTSATQVTMGQCGMFIGGAPVSLASQVVDITTDLVSGDVESANTWYYVYARPRVGRAALNATLSMVGQYVLSSEAPDITGGKPTPEAGFSSFEYRFVGTVFNDNTSDFREFSRDGNLVYFRALNSVHSATIANSPTRTTVTFNIPGTSRRALAQVQYLLTPSGAGQVQSEFRVYGAVGGSTFQRQFFFYFGAPGTVQESDSIGELALYTNAAGAIEVNAPLVETNVAARIANIAQIGYVEDIDDPLPQ